MPTTKKIDQVKSLSEKLSRSKAVFFTDYRGLTHQQLEALRKSLKKVDGEYVISKNTLIKKAMEKYNPEALKELDSELRNPTATLFAYEDEVAPIKALADFMKINLLPQVKKGWFAGRVATSADFKRLASLPTRDVLYATLAMRLKGPIYGLHYAMKWNLQSLVTALNNIKNKKPAN